MFSFRLKPTWGRRTKETLASARETTFPSAFSKVDADALSNRIPLVGVRAPIKYNLKLSFPCRDFLIACHSRYLLELHSRHISSLIMGYSMVLYATRKFIGFLLVFVFPKRAAGEIPSTIFSWALISNFSILRQLKLHSNGRDGMRLAQHSKNI